MTSEQSTAMEELEARLLAAVTGGEGDLELVAHEIAGSDHAQQYLVALVGTLGSMSADSAAAARAMALLEHGMAIAGERAEAHASEAEAGAAATSSSTASASSTTTKRNGREPS
jgi:hypothetical protein